MQNIDSLEVYLEQFGDRCFKVWSSKAVGSASESTGYITLEDFTRQGYLVIHAGKTKVGYYPVECFEFDPADNSCAFIVGDTSYRLYITELPQDAWGNTANYDYGVIFAEDCYEVYRCTEEGYEDFSSGFRDSHIHNHLDEHLKLDDFRDWLLFNYTNYDFISELIVPRISAGRDISLRIITTNRKFDSQEWQKLLENFIKEDNCKPTSRTPK